MAVLPTPGGSDGTWGDELNAWALVEHQADGTHALDAAAITSGTLDDARIPSGITRDAEAAAAYQPLDSDLTAVAGLSPTNDDILQRKAGAWTNRTMAQLISDLAALGTTFQALDATLTALAGQNWAANAMPLGSGADTMSQLALAANTFPGRSSSGNVVAKTITDAAFALLDDTDAATMRTTLGLAIGTNVQAYDAELAAVAGLTSAADKVPYFTGSGTADVATLTSFARTLLDDADAATARTTLGVAAPRMQLKVLDDSTTVTTGDGKLIFAIDAALNGLNLVAAHAYVTTVSSSGLPTVQLRNVTDAVDMLTTKISIDASEFTSYTAATAPVIDTAHDDVATGDLIAVDVDVAGTGAKGLGILLTFGP